MERANRGAAPRSVEVVQGAHETSTGRARDLVATLGSCVAVCLYDETQHIGGMTHIYRHVKEGPLGDAALVAEVETLVNDLMHQGIMRSDMRAKVTGGAHVLGYGKRHGELMAKAALRYLEAERIPVTGLSIGGETARRVRFQPWDGELFISFVNAIVPEGPDTDDDSDLNSPELF